MHCNTAYKNRLYMKDLAKAAEVNRITLWRWLRPHRAKLVAMGYRPGKPLPEEVVNYVCDWFVIYLTF